MDGVINKIWIEKGDYILMILMKNKGVFTNKTDFTKETIAQNWKEFFIAIQEELHPFYIAFSYSHIYLILLFAIASGQICFLVTITLVAHSAKV